MSKFLYVHHLAGMQWSVSFSDDQLAAAGIDEDLLQRITVIVDRETGETILAPDREAGSDVTAAENVLFAEYENEIRQSLVDAVLSPERIQDENYDALRNAVPPRHGM